MNKTVLVKARDLDHAKHIAASIIMLTSGEINDAIVRQEKEGLFEIIFKEEKQDNDRKTEIIC